MLMNRGAAFDIMQLRYDSPENISRVNHYRPHRVGPSRLGGSPWAGSFPFRARESRNFTDGSGAPF